MLGDVLNGGESALAGGTAGLFGQNSGQETVGMGRGGARGSVGQRGARVKRAQEGGPRDSLAGLGRRGPFRKREQRRQANLRIGIIQQVRLCQLAEPWLVVRQDERGVTPDAG